jgi:hypothetical protein
MQIPVTTSGRIHPYHPKMRPRLHLQLRVIRTGTLFLAVLAASAQDGSVIVNPILVNHGEPLRVSYACAEEDLQFAGLSCNEEEPCPVYLELSAVASSGRKILAAGNLHSTSATLNSIVLESDDSAATWKESAARIRGSAIEELQFFDAEHAWAAGETQYPLPRDPFVLLTTDGGATWREKSVGEEGAPGSVQRLRFDSPQHGDLLIDAGKKAEGGRYLSYESDTGGDSWTLHGASSQSPPAPRRQENSDWRIRPSKDEKTYQLETRHADVWSAAASFLIEVARCKIDPAQPHPN